MKLNRTVINIVSRLFHDSCFLTEKGFRSLVFSFPCGPCDYLLAGCLFEDVRVTDPLLLLHMNPQQLPRQFFFIIVSATYTYRCHLK